MELRVRADSHPVLSCENFAEPNFHSSPSSGDRPSGSHVVQLGKVVEGDVRGDPGGPHVMKFC
ncbi:MAG: hypothetical protein ABW091_06440, partial [Microbacterium sp.]